MHLLLLRASLRHQIFLRRVTCFNLLHKSFLCKGCASSSSETTRTHPVSSALKAAATRQGRHVCHFRGSEIKRVKAAATNQSRHVCHFRASQIKRVKAAATRQSRHVCHFRFTEMKRVKALEPDQCKNCHICDAIALLGVLRL